MKLCCTKSLDGKPEIAAIVGERVLPLRSAVEVFLTSRSVADAAESAARIVPDDMCAFLAAGGAVDETVIAAVAAEASGLSRPAEDCIFLSPVPRPGKVIGIGRNYGAHASEGGLVAQEKPRVLFKACSSVIGTGQPIPRPFGIKKLDWEMELAVVIGSPMKDIAEEKALEDLAGYTILNDVSARELQFDVQPPQTSFAKSMDGFTPMGPCMVTPDEFGDPKSVELRCWVNDTLMQEGTTADLIFPVSRILSYLSRYMTLEPGDVVATGTPAGVGHFREPPVYLQPGDVVKMEIAEIGTLSNHVI